jgi:hypothetical protein
MYYQRTPTQTFGQYLPTATATTAPSAYHPSPGLSKLPGAEVSRQMFCLYPPLPRSLSLQLPSLLKLQVPSSPSLHVFPDLSHKKRLYSVAKGKLVP